MKGSSDAGGADGGLVVSGGGGTAAPSVARVPTATTQRSCQRESIIPLLPKADASYRRRRSTRGEASRMYCRDARRCAWPARASAGRAVFRQARLVLGEADPSAPAEDEPQSRKGRDRAEGQERGAQLLAAFLGQTRGREEAHSGAQGRARHHDEGQLRQGQVRFSSHAVLL